MRASSAIISALIGSVAGILIIALWPSLLREDISTAASATMLMTLLFGPVAALVFTLVLSVHSVVLDVWQHIAPLIAAFLAAELLRRGFGTWLAAGLLFLAVGAAALFGEVQTSHLDISATSLLYASSSVALALVALLLIPRRSRLFPPHCRIRWDHVVTACFVGSASLSATSLIPAVPRAADGKLEQHLLSLLLLAYGISFVSSKWLEHLTRKNGGGLLQRLRHEKRTRVASLSLLPREILVELLRIHRDARRIAQSVLQLSSDLLRARVDAERQQGLLDEASRSLRSRSILLARVVRRYRSLSAQLKAVLDHAPEPLVFVDQNKRIERASTAIARLIGYKPSALVGHPLGLLIPPNYIDTHPLDLRSDERNSSTSALRESRVAAVRRADGRARRLSIRIHEYAVSDVRHYLIRLRDPDPTKQALAALSRARATLRNVQESRQAFIGSMSHEFRTPLHGLIAMIDMLRDEPLSPAGKQKLGIAKASAKSLLKLANDILDWSRIQSGSFSFDSKLFELSALINELFEEVGPRATAKNLQLRFEVPGELPPTLRGDPHRIKQVLGNLLTNAVKFTERGEIRLKARYECGHCIIDVIDSGPGIAPEMLESIFQPFVQARTATQRQEGAGLGLAISRQLCEAMRGRLYVQESSFAGSTFRVELPLEASDQAPDREQSLRIFRNPKGRILVVEDHPTNQFVVKSMLEALKCDATIASSGIEALDLLDKHRFDLILMDCRMPGMDGLEATRRIRASPRGRSVPIIAMTANSMQEDLEECKHAGMEDFLPKPFGRAALHDILCRWLKPQKAADTDSLTQKLARFPAIDQEVFSELWENLQWRKPPMRRISESFCETTRETLRLLADSDHTALSRNLHTLLGTAGMIGARQIEQLAALLQDANRSRRLGDLACLERRFAVAVAAFEKEFATKLEEGASSRSEIE